MAAAVAAYYAGPEARGYRPTNPDRQYLTPVKQPPGHVSTGDDPGDSYHDSNFMDDTVNWHSSHARQGNGIVVDLSLPASTIPAHFFTATAQGNDPVRRVTTSTPIAGRGDCDSAVNINPIMITRKPGGQGVLGGGRSRIAGPTLTSPATAAISTGLPGNQTAAAELISTCVDWAAFLSPAPGARSSTSVMRVHSLELFGRDTHSHSEVRSLLQGGIDTGTGTPGTGMKGAGVRDSNSSMGMGGDNVRRHGHSGTLSGSGSVGLNQSGVGRA